MKDFLNNREASFVAIRDPDWPIWLCGNFEITANKVKNLKFFSN